MRRDLVFLSEMIDAAPTTTTDKLPDLVAMLRAALVELSGDDAGESIELHDQGEA